MRIAFLTFEFPPESGGGLSTYMQHVLEMLHKNGDQAFVIVVDNTVQTTKIEKYKGHDIVRVNVANQSIMQTLGYWPAASYVIAEELAKAIKMFGVPEYVESCDGFGLAYYTLQRKHTLEVPFKDLKVVVTAHTPCALIDKWTGKSWYELPRYWTKESELFCFKAADMVQAPSQFIIDALKSDFECEDVQFRLVRNPYKAEPVKKAFNKPNADQSITPYYIYGSRIAFWKGALDVVAAFNTYWKAGGRAQLKMFGGDSQDAPNGGSLTEHIKTKYSEDVTAGRLHLLGLVSSEELANQKLSALALIHPSHNENLPYTVVEHMAEAGIVIAASNGGQAELISHGKSGLLFQPKKPAAILDCIRQFEAMTPAAKASMGQAALDQISKMCDYDVVYAERIKNLGNIKEERENFPFLRGKQHIFNVHSGSVPPLLSVVVPYYQLPDFIEETVQSALASTYPNLEIVIVDDGSKDDRSPEVLKKISKDSRVRVLRKENGGVAAARNFGVANARGAYIALLDADDLVLPTYYERCLNILNKYKNVGFVGCWNDDFDEKGTIRHWPTFNPEPPMQLIFNTTNCQGIVMFKEAYNIGSGHDSDLNMFLDDWEATISMLAKGVRGVMIPDPLFRYRIRGGSIFRSRANEWEKNYEYIVNKHSSTYAKYAKEIICFLNANGPNTGYHNPTFSSKHFVYTEGNSSANISMFANGRLYKLILGYYRFTQTHPKGKLIRQKINFLSPFLDFIMILAYRFKRRMGI